MPLLTARTVVLAKVESTYNTDPTPTAAADAVLVGNLQQTRPTDVLDREVLDQSLSPFQPLIGRKLGQVTFDVELKGSGTNDTPPDWGPLLRACGFAETINASTNVIYDPASDSIDSITIYVYRDGLLYKYTGARGNVVFRFPAGQRPMMSFTFTGHLVDVIDASLVTPTLQSTLPVPVKNTSFTVGGFAGVVSQLELDAGSNVVAPDDINAADGYGEIIVASRTMQGSFDPEQTLVATRDWWSKWEDGTQEALTLTLNGGAGNTIQFDIDKLTYRQLDDADRDGILAYQAPFTAARTSGDDEVQITHT